MLSLQLGAQLDGVPDLQANFEGSGVQTSQRKAQKSLRVIELAIGHRGQQEGDTRACNILAATDCAAISL